MIRAFNDRTQGSQKANPTLKGTGRQVNL